MSFGNPTPAEIAEIFIDRGTHLEWRVTRSNRRLSGEKAGYVGLDGYLLVGMQGKKYRAHRLLWILRNGSIPDGMQIDHVDRNRLNNCPENLRLATPAENCRNRKQQSNNTTGERGVYWHKQLGKWAVRVRRDGKLVNGGIFKTFESAVVAARILRELLHAEFSGLSRDE